MNQSNQFHDVFQKRPFVALIVVCVSLLLFFGCLQGLGGGGTAVTQAKEIQQSEEPSVFASPPVSVSLPALVPTSPVGLNIIPVWFSADQSFTNDLAWGDVDNDGDLDLAIALGSESQPGRVKIYENAQGLLSEEPILTFSYTGIVNALTWADANMDGYLDLAVGVGKISTPTLPHVFYVHFSQAGILPSTPNWESQEVAVTADLAWGDVDGDGDLDLATASYQGPNRLYRYHNGQLESTAFWSSDNTNDNNISLTWGDIDRDGDLDLMVGSQGDQQTKLYENQGGELDSSPVYFGEVNDVNDIALGDMNCDGYLDLAVATGVPPSNQPPVPIPADPQINKVYANIEGTFMDTPLWVSAIEDVTNSVTWGDPDADGDLDLATGNWGEANRIYLNEGCQLQTEPVWSSGSDDRNRGLAWADVDGDGDLDLAAANSNQPSVLYYNENSGLEYSFGWQTDANAYQSYAVTWGDVDGDGDLDLATIRGSGSQPTRSTLFLNEQGGLSSVPTWSASEADLQTRHVAWGDVDGDGDLDLAAGNLSAANRVYFNIMGRLEETASWIAPITEETQSVAWGDMDGDGDLDLAVGTGNPQGAIALPNRIYENNNGELTSVWQSTEEDVTLQVAWGDVDNDGDLDLAAANYLSPGRVYLNENGRLEETASWTTGITTFARAVAWGDVNGDGYLDLAVANDFSPNKIYLNENGRLQTTPGWTSADSDRSNGLAWGDMDGDGDLDLAVANGTPFDRQRTKVYMNHRGTLETSASWQVSSTSPGYSVAWGDVDQDGDLDLAIGNLGVAVRLHYNHQPLPAYNGHVEGVVLDLYSEPVQTFNQSVMALAPANYYGVPGIRQDGTIPITYTLLNHANQPVERVEAFYSLNGGDEWHAATPLSTTQTHLLSTASTRPFRSTGTLPLTIPAIGSVAATFYVSSSQIIEDLDVWLTLAHADVSQLSLYLVSPAGTPISLAAGVSGTNYTETVFDDQAGEDIVTGEAPFIGRFRPIGNLSDADGQNIQGTWQLIIVDGVAGQGGTLENWGLYLNSGSDAVYTGATDVSIPANNTVETTLFVSETKPILDVDVWLNATHPDVSDLAVTLVSPLGTEIELFTNLGSGQNLLNTLFDDQAATTWVSGTAPFTGLFLPEERLTAVDGEIPAGTWTLRVSSSGAGGVLHSWGLELKTAESGTHLYEWDVYNSGFFGQSDNVTFRLVAYPTWQVDRFGQPGPFQLPFAAAQTYPFRVRGSQIRVFSDTITGTQPISGAMVYLLPGGTISGALPIQNPYAQSFYTDEHGYLQGRGSLAATDQLIALWPVPDSPTSVITFTDQYSLYYTSAPATPTGLDMPEIGDSSGVYTMTISTENQLLLYNLDVSLEWDARRDQTFLTQLNRDLISTSRMLYDLTNGQVALGRIQVYNAKENWLTADIAIHASNTQRPNANLGGIVTAPITQVISTTFVITDAYYTILPGQVRIGPMWNRYGDPTGTPGEDWPRALAHELGHYLLFLLDNYLGIDENGLITYVDCQGSAMTDAYRLDYSEFLDRHTPTGDGYLWEGEDECLATLAQKAVMRSDWETIQTFYPFPSHQLTQTLSGPSILPLAVTHVSLPDEGGNTFPASNYYYLVDGETGDTLPLPIGEGEAFLFKTQNTDDLTDDTIIPLGTPVGPLLLSRGTEPGDRICVFNPVHTPIRLGCVADIDALTSVIPLYEVPDWQPQVTVSPINSTTLLITATNVVEDSLWAQILPAYGPPTATGIISSPVQLMNAVGEGVFTQTFQFPFTVFNGFVRVWVEDSDPLREAVSHFFLTPGWNGNNFVGWGGNNFLGWGGNSFIGWGANVNSWNAPVSSPDGQVMLFNVSHIFANVASTLQRLTIQPDDLPSWLTSVGQAYRYETADSTPAELAIQFQYLQQDLVPLGINEGYLSIYFRPRGETSAWQRLDTTLRPERNQAISAVPGPGIYLLAATIPLPALEQGWDQFTYPDVPTLPVTTALASIEGDYTSVFSWDEDGSNTWQLHDQTVVTPFQSLVNDLLLLRPYYIYSIYALTNTTPYIGVFTDSIPLQPEGLQLPPATFYGWISQTEQLTVGMPVTAVINGVVCGNTAVTTVMDGTEERLAYKLYVRADSGDGCGANGRTVTFYVNDQEMAESFTFDTDAVWNRQAWFHSLSLPEGYELYLPVVIRP